ncbi:MAG: desulfoferrodoxin [archaeon]
MTQIQQIYKCDICGNIIEVLHSGADALVCCNQPMILQKENSIDAANEKHIPVIEKTPEEKTIVKIGKIEHPMTNEHYIEWIGLENKDKNKICRKNLKPEEKPESKFCAKTENVKARCYCNLHGLWKSK